MTFAPLDYANKKRVTRREKFLCEMDTVIPWGRLIAVIELHYPKTNPRGGRPTGVDAESGLVHTVVTSTASVNDKCRFDDLLHDEETAARADRGYDYSDICRRCTKRGQFLGIAIRKTLGEPRWQVDRQINHLISKVRARVEHPFRIIERQFGFTKVRYRGLEKNTAQIHSLFALANRFMARQQLAQAV